MLYFGMNARFNVFCLQLVGAQLLPGAGAFGDVPVNVVMVFMVVGMQQIARRHNIVNIGSRGVYTVNQPKRAMALMCIFIPVVVNNDVR